LRASNYLDLLFGSSVKPFQQRPGEAGAPRPQVRSPAAVVLT
jgi:hypothetical protein